MLLLLLLACGARPAPPAPVPSPATAQAPAGSPGLAPAGAPAGGALEPFERDALWGYRDAAGVERIAPRYPYASAFIDRVAWVVDGGELWWIDTAGAPIARAYNYDNGADEFVEGLARLVDDRGRVGFLDPGGRVVVPPTWDFAAPFELGRAVVCTGCGPEDEDEHARLVGGAWGAIDTLGQVVVPVELAGWEQAQAAAARRRLTLDPEVLTVDEAAGVATYSPDSRRMAAEYTVYVLDLAGLRAALGEVPTQPVEIEIALRSVEESSHTPADPNLPAPQGGFRITTITAEVVGR